jgi:hypothetical protein
MRMQINFEGQHNAITPFGQARLAFSQKSFLKRLGLGFLVQFGNQCTGEWSVLYSHMATLRVILPDKAATRVLSQKAFLPRGRYTCF